MLLLRSMLHRSCLKEVRLQLKRRLWQHRACLHHKYPLQLAQSSTSRPSFKHPKHHHYQLVKQLLWKLQGY